MLKLLDKTFLIYNFRIMSVVKTTVYELKCVVKLLTI